MNLGTEGVLKLIDFGESKMVKADRMYSEFVGTIHYVESSDIAVFVFFVFGWDANTQIPPEIVRARSGR